jgi:hypothetical protein
VGAETLTESWTGIRHIEVAGLEGYSPLDLADPFADAVGRPVEAIVVPRADWETLWVSQVMPEGRRRLGWRWSMDSIPAGFTLAYPEQSMWMDRRRFVS